VPVTPDMIVSHAAGFAQGYKPLSLNTF